MMLLPQHQRVTMVLPLPSPQQTWSHCTNSVEELMAALENEEITAIEADILLGHVPATSISCDRPTRSFEPIMAHPPNRTSNLSTRSFLEHTILPTRVLRKHIKLDLKEMEAVPRTLDLLRQRLLLSPPACSSTSCSSLANDEAQPGHGSTLFLNADIYPGPGARTPHDCTINADEFVEACLGFLENRPKNLQMAFSLGFKVDYRAETEYYTHDDCRRMTNLVRRYSLHEKSGTVRCFLCIA
jgi:Uncharacterized conserved protein (DUF2181)